MASSRGPKVVLKNTTRMSLNERFTEMLSERQPVLVTIRTNMEPEQEPEQPLPSDAGTSKASGSGSAPKPFNSESRPSVRAALTLQADRLKQGLGKSSIHARLGWPLRSQAGRAAGGWRGSFSGGSSGGGGSNGGEMQGGWVPRYRWQGSRGRRYYRDQDPPQSRSAAPQMRGRKGGVRRGLGWGGSSGHGGMSTGGQTGQGSSRRQGFFGGRGYGRRRGTCQPVLTKEELDDQLDAYMAKTREQLDAELNAYMVQTDEESDD
ncbi:chromatin target of PRMT1 protein-like [Phascolarctos cinereus]